MSLPEHNKDSILLSMNYLSDEKYQKYFSHSSKAIFIIFPLISSKYYFSEFVNFILFFLFLTNTKIFLIQIETSVSSKLRVHII